MIYAVILAGGIGTRMKMPGAPKQYKLIKDKPLVMYSVEIFQKTEIIDRIIIVAANEWEEEIKEWMKQYSITKFGGIAKPGASRQESIFSGVTKCFYMSENEQDIVIIHDGVRPLVTCDLVTRCALATLESGACMPVIPVKDTIYCSTNREFVTGLLDRNILYAGQTPEGYNLHKYYEINNSSLTDELKNISGSSEIAYKHDMKVKLIDGDESNFKITTESDYIRFKKFLVSK